mgnify:CR=1 FL=1
MAVIKKFKIKSYKKVQSIIELKNISVFYNKRQIIENLSLSINKQEILGMLGPNGVGKSTIFNLITGLKDPNYGEIISGKDPNVSVVSGMFQSFNDAPGGFKEEMREINISVGSEYWYNNQFAIRAGYFNEHDTKGARKYFTFGSGVKYNVFELDFSYLVNTSRNLGGVTNPLANTMRFTLLFDFGEI